MEIPVEKTTLIPRKIVGGITAMYILLLAAEKLQVTGWEKIVVILCMTALGGMAIFTHYLLESKNPTNGNGAK